MGVFFSLSLSLLCLLEFSLNDPTLEGVNFDLWRVSGQGLDAVACLLYFISFYFYFFYFPLAVPGCCHAAAIHKPKAPKHAHDQTIRAHNSAPPTPSASRQHSSSQTITISSFLASLFTQSCEGSFFVRNIGWDSFTKCTLYVFSKASRKTRALISVPTLADSLLSVFLFLPHHHFHVLFLFFFFTFSGVSYHYAVLQKL